MSGLAKANARLGVDDGSAAEILIIGDEHRQGVLRPLEVISESALIEFYGLDRESSASLGEAQPSANTIKQKAP